jgi:uncharacterized protein (TIGR03663 family)
MRRWALGLAAAGLLALAVLPRFVLLDTRPVIHDESLFSYYSLIFRERSHYAHDPMLHGPALMLSLGTVFSVFDDTITVGRAFVAACSLVVLGLLLALAPPRARWWLAPLLATSPVLLYFSRFVRNEMFYNALALIGMAGVVWGLSERRGRALGAVLGALFSVSLLAVKENVLFLYAAALTFAVACAGSRAWRGRAGGAEQDHVNVSTRISGARSRAAWIVGLVLGTLAAAAVFGVALPVDRHQAAIEAVVGAEAAPEGPLGVTGESLTGIQKARVLGHLMAGSWRNARASWDYWEGQHREHRVAGALHYHLPILLTYELPLLLFLLAGLVRDGCSERRRAGTYLSSLAVWLLLWVVWRAVALPEPPGWLGAAQDWLHLGPNASMLVLGLVIAPLLAWSLLSLGDRRPLASWAGWWAACSLFQYSAAGEKVPWLSVHIVLPLYLVLAWLWEPALGTLRRRGRVAAVLLVALAAGIALRNDVYLIGPRAADPRERLVYNHTTPFFDELARNSLALWSDEASSVPLRERRIVLAGDPGWPGVWYFRDARYELVPADPPLERVDADVDLVIGTLPALGPLLEGEEAARFVRLDGSLRDHWWAPWPEEERWWPPDGAAPRRDLALLGRTLRHLWRYYWFRETWTDPGGFPIVALDPRNRR